MPIPVGTDQYSWKTPVATLALVTLNVVVYSVLLLAERKYGGRFLQDVLSTGGLSSGGFRPWQPVTYQFLHDPSSIWHVVGNMLFLWIFGSSVENRLRWWGFLAHYLGGGAAAGAVQLLSGGALIIGASGAVMAVTGSFIVFFPRARVNVFLLLSVVPMPAMLLVAIYLVLDMLGVVGVRGPGVAYLAHVAGFAFGFTVSMLLLGLGLVRRTDLDLLFRIRQAHRRARMRALVRDGNSPIQASGVQPPAKLAVPVVEPTPTVSKPANTRLATRCLDDATAAYAKGEFVKAADSYQRALDAAPLAQDADQTRLMLAVIYGRKLKKPQKAREFLHALSPNLPEKLSELAAALRVEVKA